MIGRFVLVLLVFSTIPTWSQTDTPSSVSTGTSSDESPMVAPPPVSGEAFSATPMSEQRSNYLSLGITGEASYLTNVVFGTASPVNDEIYSILPTLSFNRTSFRLREALNYSPGFTFYQHVTAYNQSSENLSGQVGYKPSEHSDLLIHDSFAKTSNIFSAPYSLAVPAVSGSPAIQAAGVIVPFGNEISNTGGGQFTYQFSQNGMIGAGGGVSEYDFPNPSQTPGLTNGNGYMGSVFFNDRIAARQYGGARVDFTSVHESGKTGDAQIRSESFTAFYSFDLGNNLSFSVSGGPQYYSASTPGIASTDGWEPTIIASVHAGLSKMSGSLSYQYGVVAGGGLTGAFNSSIANADISVQMNRTWSFGVSGSYADDSPIQSYFGLGGHGLTANGSLRHAMGSHVHAEVGYSYLHQDYAGIAAIAASPTSQRVYGTISYQLTRPLGR